MASAPAYTAIDEPNPSALLESRRRWREPLDEPPQYFVENQSWRPGDPPAPPRRDPAGAKSETVAATGVQALHPVTDMEGLGEQVRNLKKELAAARAENRLFKVGKERAEIELSRAEYEGEQALKTNAIVDGSGVAGQRPEVRLNKQLKAKNRELQELLASKEAQVSELGGQTRGVRVKELEIQTKTYLEEARRLKEVSRLQAVEKEHALGVLRAQHADALSLKEGQNEVRTTDHTAHTPSPSLQYHSLAFLQMHRSYGGSANASERRIPPWTTSLAAGWTRTKCCVRRSANCRAAVQASGVRRSRSSKRRRRRPSRSLRRS